jgi:hypothetical protein
VGGSLPPARVLSGRCHRTGREGRSTAVAGPWDVARDVVWSEHERLRSRYPAAGPER